MFVAGEKDHVELRRTEGEGHGYEGRQKETAAVFDINHHHHLFCSVKPCKISCLGIYYISR